MRAVAVALALAPLALACAPPPALTVMTFNIRYGTAADGPDAWPQRRAHVITVIRETAPDVLAVQEALRFQLDELARAFPAYAELGVGRDDGVAAGEYAAIFYRPDRLVVDTSGTFWLSDTPEVPGSASWGNRITRICTWALFRERASGRRFATFNVHLDHESQPSRERAVALVLVRAGALDPGTPLILLGDFNAGEDNPALAPLRAATFRDTFRDRHPEARWVGTFNGFQGDSTGAKIDHIFVRGAWTVEDAAILRRRFDGRDPSDHFPVTARLGMPK